MKLRVYDRLQEMTKKERKIKEDQTIERKKEEK